MIADTIKEIRPKMIWQNLDEISEIIQKINEKNQISNSNVLFPFFNQLNLYNDESNNDDNIDFDISKVKVNTQKSIKNQIEKDDLDLELDNIINSSFKEKNIILTKKDSVNNNIFFNDDQKFSFLVRNKKDLVKKDDKKDLIKKDDKKEKKFIDFN
jgi:hypothetical protein